MRDVKTNNGLNFTRLAKTIGKSPSYFNVIRQGNPELYFEYMRLGDGNPLNGYHKIRQKMSDLISKVESIYFYLDDTYGRDTYEMIIPKYISKDTFPTKYSQKRVIDNILFSTSRAKYYRLLLKIELMEAIIDKFKEEDI